MDSIPKLTPHKPRRGAPLGNKNALKTGFYSRYYNQLDKSDLASVSSGDLQEEIGLLRVFIRHVIEEAQKQGDLSNSLTVLRALSVATFSLSRLVRIQYLVTPKAEDEMNATIRQAISEIGAELGIGPDFFDPPPVPSQN